MEQDHIHETKDNPLYYGQYKKTTDRSFTFEGEEAKATYEEAMRHFQMI